MGINKVVQADGVKKIDKEDLIFENAPFKDRIITRLELNDYDWMKYILSASFKTKTQGELEVRFEYYGVIWSEMHVIQQIEETCKTYTYSFPTDIFEKYILKYMKRHINQWKTEDVFYGGDIVLEFYNEILQKGHLENG